MLKVDSVTHWSIPVNDLEEAEKFYRDVLGLEYKGRLSNTTMACFTVAEHNGYANRNITNSGYTIATPMDFVLELVK